MGMKCPYLNLALSRGSSRSNNSLASSDRSLGRSSLGGSGLGRGDNSLGGGRRAGTSTGNALRVPVVLSSTVVTSNTVSGTGESVTTTLSVGRGGGSCGRTSCSSDDESGVLHLDVEWKQREKNGTLGLWKKGEKNERKTRCQESLIGRRAGQDRP